MQPNDHGVINYSRRVWITVGIVAAVTILLVALWFGYRILLMVFAGLMLALFLSIPAGWLQRHSPLSQRWSLVVVLVSLAALMTAFLLNFAFNLNQEFAQLTEVLPGSLQAIKDWVANRPLGAYIVDRFDRSSPVEDVFGTWSSRVSSLFSSTLGMLLNVVVIVFIALFVSFEPSFYKNGLLKLFFPSKRQEVVELIDEIEHKMAWWLLGRLTSMAGVGLLSGIGLWLLDIPMAFTLGLLAAMLSFIPYLGPVMSSVPALLVAFSQSPVATLHVALLYGGIQLTESYLLTPLVQREAVSIPPALLLVVQVWLGLFAGLMGVLVAEPLILLSMVLIQRLYIEGWVEKQGDTNVDQKSS